MRVVSRSNIAEYFFFNLWTRNILYEKYMHKGFVEKLKSFVNYFQFKLLNTVNGLYKRFHLCLDAQLPYWQLLIQIPLTVFRLQQCNPLWLQPVVLIHKVHSRFVSIIKVHVYQWVTLIWFDWLFGLFINFFQLMNEIMLLII